MRTRGWLAVLVLVTGCSPEPSWQEGPIGTIYDGLTVGGAGGCSTFVVDGLSQQLIAEQNCIRSNALVSFAGKPGISIGSNVYPYLEPKAAAGIEAAGATGSLNVTSAFRTVAQQYLLYQWYQAGQCGISLAAVPGNSNHETGIAVDLGNYSSVIGLMTAQGWTHTYPTSDPVHFDYTAGGTVDLRSENVLAFQRLWNLNNPSDKIAEDGAYGPVTGTKLAASPATGFDKGSTCDTTTPPPPPPASELAAVLTAQSIPQALVAGETQPAWVEFKNTGTATWEPGMTSLGTTEPQDRDSALFAPDWLSAKRPASVGATTKPGATGRFTFSLGAPLVTAPEALTEHFGLVQEGVAWFPDPASLTIDVTISPATGKGDNPSDPNGGGTTPTAMSSAHHGCSIGGAGDGAPAAGLALLFIGLTLFARLRASYSLGRCRASVDSSSFWSSRSR